MEQFGKLKELLVVEKIIKRLVSSSVGITPTYIEESFIHGDNRKLARIAIQNLILDGELVYDEHMRLQLKEQNLILDGELVYDEHMRLQLKEQKQMTTYNNIQEVFTALSNGKKLRKTNWISKVIYVHFYDGFILWNNGDPYCDSFNGSWEEYIEEKLSFDDLEVGKSYMRTDVEECNSFMVLYKTKNLFVARYNNNEDELCYYKYDYTTYKQV